jgi:putative ABC transport system permease protein
MAILILLICSTAFPAWWLATSKIINDLKGIHGPGHHSSLGRSLLIAQFIISIICISATLMVGRQLDYIHHKDLGIDRKNLVILTMPEDFSVKSMKALKQEIKSIAGVSGVSNSSFRIGGAYWKDWYTVESNGEMKSVELHEVFSDDDLFSTLGMKLIDGRFFNDEIPADSGAAYVINETAARELGWEDPVGKRILTHPEEKGKWDGTVVGVVADINISTLHEKVQPLVMRLPWQKDYPEYFVYIRIAGPVSETVQMIKEKYNALVPGYPIDLAFVDEFYNSKYQKENKAFASLLFGTFIIVLVSSLGIFSLSIYMSVRRMREFGIRKVLGATVRQITLMHVGHFLRLAVIANLIALPVSYWLMKEWLNGFAYRTDLSFSLFLLVMVISFLLVIFSAGYSAVRAGRLNPVDVIRNS